MMISASISLGSEVVRVNSNRMASTENVSIGVLATYSIVQSSKAVREILWGIEVTNNIAVSPSGESIVLRLVTDYTVNGTAYTRSSDYNITSLLGSVNISTPFTNPTDSEAYSSSDSIVVHLSLSH